MRASSAVALQQRVLELEAENARLRANLQASLTGAVPEDSFASAQHRVRNTLALVRAIMARTADSSGTVEEFAAHLRGRVDTLVRLQGVLTRPGPGLDLEELVWDELMAQGGLVANQAEVGGPLVALRSPAAEVLGLAIHELAANSVKFGALSHDEGRVAVQWQVQGADDAPSLELEWLETGGPPAPDDAKRGFGRELIESGLPYQIAARTAFDFHRDGVRCSIALPISPGAIRQTAAP